MRTTRNKRVTRNIQYYTSLIEVLQVGAGELNFACLAFIVTKLLSVREVLFPRLMGLYWTVWEPLNAIQNLQAFSASPFLTSIVLDLTSASEVQLPARLVQHVVDGVKTFLPRLQDVSIVCASQNGRPSFPGYALRYCTPPTRLSIQMDIKGALYTSQ